jgi:outer membrane protein assembly factor BamB
MLYAIDGTTMTAIWHTKPRELSVGGKYTTVTAANGVVFVGTDRIQAYGVQ